MTKAVSELIKRAKKFDSLKEDIKALEELGDSANGKAKEFKSLLEAVTKLEKPKEVKVPELKGVIKFVKLQKSPFSVGLSVYTTKEFELDINALAKQDIKQVAKIKRAIELGMIKAS